MSRIRAAVISAVYMARNDRDRPGHTHKVFVMATSPKWSIL